MHIILVKGTIAITGAGAGAAARQADERKLKEIAPFTDHVSEIMHK